jgi:hypothetical protein
MEESQRVDLFPKEIGFPKNDCRFCSKDILPIISNKQSEGGTNITKAVAEEAGMI